MYEAVESSDHAPPPPAAAAAASFIHNNLPADSWTQTLLMGGLAANEEEDKLFTQNHLQFLPAFSTNLHPTSHQFSTGRVAKRPKIQHSSSKTTTTIKLLQVRKEKLGDRITALHQLVSPFGKTDTATVLLEAIGYIKFLEKQIQALSVPYMGHGHGSAKNMGHEQQHHECDGEEGKKSLRSRGLCLVPISCTLENGSADYYWAPMHN